MARFCVWAGRSGVGHLPSGGALDIVLLRSQHRPQSIYHYISVKHLHRYLNEFTFRYNHRNQANSAGFYSLIENCAGRLTYEALIA